MSEILQLGVVLFTDLVVFEIPNRLGEEACSDQVKKARRDYEKDLNGREVSSPTINQILIRWRDQQLGLTCR